MFYQFSLVLVEIEIYFCFHLMYVTANDMIIFFWCWLSFRAFRKCLDENFRLKINAIYKEKGGLPAQL